MHSRDTIVDMFLPSMAYSLKQGKTPTLDLHGYRREAATREVVVFLESHRQRKLVSIVTGTGSHSHDGPVLRSAVEEFLTKYKFSYSRDSPGSFLVEPCSGRLGYHQAACDEDTKVIVGNENDEIINAHIESRKSLKKKGYAGLTPGMVMPEEEELPVEQLGPTVKEAGDSERDLAEAKKESLEFQRLLAKQVTKDKRAMEQACAMSARDTKNRGEEEEAALQQAIAASKEAFQALEQEEEQLRKALIESERAASWTWDSDDDDALEKVLEMSRQASQADNTHSSKEEDENDLVNQAIALSLRD